MDLGTFSMPRTSPGDRPPAHHPAMLASRDPTTADADVTPEYLAGNVGIVGDVDRDEILPRLGRRIVEDAR